MWLEEKGDQVQRLTVGWCQTAQIFEEKLKLGELLNKPSSRLIWVRVAQEEREIVAQTIILHTLPHLVSSTSTFLCIIVNENLIV